MLKYKEWYDNHFFFLEEGKCPVSTKTEGKGVGLGSGGLINGVKQGIDASNAIVTE